MKMSGQGLIHRHELLFIDMRMPMHVNVRIH